MICSLSAIVSPVILRPFWNITDSDIYSRIYVGDIQGDYDASRAAGVDFIHAAYGFGTIREEVPKIDRFSDLPEVMKEIY